MRDQILGFPTSPQEFVCRVFNPPTIWAVSEKRVFRGHLRPLRGIETNVVNEGVTGEASGISSIWSVPGRCLTDARTEKRKEKERVQVNWSSF